MLLCAAVAWAIGSLVNRYADLPSSPLRTSGMQMLTGGAFMIGLGLVLGEAGRFDPAAVSGESALMWLYLVAVAVVAIPSYTWLMTASSPALVGTYAFVNPVVAVLLGWAVAGEALNERTALAGCWSSSASCSSSGRESAAPGRRPAPRACGAGRNGGGRPAVNRDDALHTFYVDGKSLLHPARGAADVRRQPLPRLVRRARHVPPVHRCARHRRRHRRAVRALEVPSDLSVLVVTKDRVTESNSSYAQGGIAGVRAPEDTFENHVEDTLVAGDGLCDRSVVERVVHEAPNQIEKLIAFGTKFDEENGARAHPRGGAQSPPHRSRVGDSTGFEMMRATIARATSR